MSTALLDTYPATAGALAVDIRAPRLRGGHLSLVPQPVARPVVRAGAEAPFAALRITRRGRLALTCTVALAILLAMVTAVSTLTPAGAAAAVVVEPGMTLTQIAAEHLPDVPLSQAVADIQQANRLSTTSIAVGQELVIPGR